MNKLKRIIRYDYPLHFVLLLTNWLPDNVFFIRLRGRLARPFFKKCGKRLGLGRNLVFYNPSQISIGTDVYIAYGCWFSCGFPVEIKDEVLFGPYVVVASSNHTRLNGSFRFGKSVGKPVTINKGAWIGANCAILAGTTIGDGTVIAANSVAKGNIPSKVIFAGNPGEVKKQFND